MSSLLLFLLWIAPAAQVSSFAVPGASGLSVQIRHPDGPPWQGVAVGLSSPSGLVLPNITYTDGSGEAVFPVLCPGNDYQIRIYAESRQPFLTEDISVAAGGYTVLLINPYAAKRNRLIQLELPLNSVGDEQEFQGTKSWVVWGGVRDPLTGTYHSGSLPVQLFCPDGIYPILGGLPDPETIRWLRRGFGAKHRPEKEAPMQPELQLWL